MGWVMLALLLVPILEIYVIVQVGQVIGAWPTVALLLFESLLGAWIIKYEGRKAWAALQQALATGRMPGRELADGALVLVGGTLLLTPGFLTDIVGFFFVLPFTRPLARRLLGWYVARRFVLLTSEAGRGGGGPQGPAWGPGGSGPSRGPTGDPRVVPGEVIEGEVVEGEIVDDGAHGTDKGDDHPTGSGGSPPWS